MKSRIAALMVAFFCAACTTPAAGAADTANSSLRQVVDHVIVPVMKSNRIPGMAVAVTLGEKSYVFTYGVASRNPRRPVTQDTLFEIGSISKTFTATLASYAQGTKHLSLSDNVAKYLPSLKGTAFGNVTLLELGTHTPGGLPLQVPDGIENDDQLLQYFKTWRPTYAPGTYRTYSNPGIGTLGLIAAKSMRRQFTALIQTWMFPAFGMKNSFIIVPEAKMSDYAWGYTQDGKPVRMTPGELYSETYGIKSTAADMIRFVEANMNELHLEGDLQRAVSQTHTAYFKAGRLTQDLIWEQYRYPVALKSLLAGNSPALIFEPTRATRIVPPEPPRQDVWLNKTGSTNGFGAYVALVPERKIGIAILANKNYPIADRVTAAYEILTHLAAQRP